MTLHLHWLRIVPTTSLVHAYVMKYRTKDDMVVTVIELRPILCEFLTVFSVDTEVLDLAVNSTNCKRCVNAIYDWHYRQYKR